MPQSLGAAGSPMEMWTSKTKHVSPSMLWPWYKALCMRDRPVERESISSYKVERRELPPRAGRAPQEVKNILRGKALRLAAETGPISQRERRIPCALAPSREAKGPLGDERVIADGN